MQPKLELLTPELVNQILDEAFQLLKNPGVKVLSKEARKLLASGGAHIDEINETAHIPEMVIRQVLEHTPKEFHLYDQNGNPTVFYGGDAVHFDPGSSGVNVLDPDTGEHRPAQTPDLLRIIQVAEGLPQMDAQSTAVVCADVPEAMGDIYRLYLLLMYSAKPIVTGAFSSKTMGPMIEMLALAAGGLRAPARIS